MTKKKAFELLTFNDHGILGSQEVKKISEAFGLGTVHLRKIQDQRSEFKGAYFPSLKERDYFEGIGTMELAHEICKHLGINEQVGSYNSRGSQMRAYCEAIKQHEAL